MSPKQTDQLFHYTSAAGVRGMIADRLAWASMVQYMNDGEELNYALSLARMILAEVAATTAEADPRVKLCNDYLDAAQMLAAFAFSLSEDDDLLSQWRAYCPPEGGYSVGFSKSALLRIAEVHGGELVKCVYDPDEQRRMLLHPVQEMWGVACQLPASALVIHLHRELADSLTRVCLAIKHPTFVEEAEWRLTLIPPRFDKVKYRPQRGLVIPYLDLSFGNDTSTISRIVVGPHRYPPLAVRSLHLMTSELLGWPLLVAHTSTPFQGA